MIKTFFLIVLLLTFKETFSQRKEFYYIDSSDLNFVKYKVIGDSSNWILKIFQKEYSFVKLDSNSLKFSDTVVSLSNSDFDVIGPFFMKREENKIYRIIKSSDTLKIEKQLFYLLDKYQPLLKPDFFSNSNSYYIESKYYGDTSITINNVKFLCYKFIETIERYHKTTHRIVLVDKEYFLPIRIEYYKQLNRSPNKILIRTLKV